MSDAILTSHDVAARLDQHPDTILRRMRAGDLPGAFQLNGRGSEWRIRESAFDAWIDSKAAPDPHRIEQRTSRSRSRRAAR